MVQRLVHGAGEPAPMTESAAKRTAAKFFSNKGKICNFTRLHVRIVEEDGAFTVRVRMINHLKTEQRAFGEEVAATFEMASSMVGMLAAEFSIPQDCISMKIVMRNYREGVFH
jgi:hypothetical protein